MAALAGVAGTVESRPASRVAATNPADRRLEEGFLGRSVVMRRDFRRGGDRARLDEAMTGDNSYRGPDGRSRPAQRWDPGVRVDVTCL